MKNVIIAVLFVAQSIAQGSIQDEALPRSWYLTSEDMVRMPSNKVDEIFNNSNAALDRVLRNNNQILDNLRAANRQSSAEDWYLSSLRFDLGISLSGLIGVLVAKGDVGAKLYWKQRSLANVVEASESDEKFDAIRIHEGMSRQQLISELRPIVNAVMATGEVQDGNALRKNLLEVAEEFQELTPAMYSPPDSAWNLSRFRFDVKVEASGKVYPGVTVGGGIKLRFEWHPRSVDRTPVLTTEKQRNLKKLLDQLARCMDEVTVTNFQPRGWYLKNVQFGLGLYGQAKFGVAKGKLSATFLTYFKPSRNQQFPKRKAPAGVLPVLTNDATAEHLYKLSQRDIPTEVYATRGEVTQVAYVSSDKFVKGLGKANKIASFFAERSNKNQASRWDLYQMKTKFALSLAGDVGMITIGGTGSIQLTLGKN